jgi:uncharacterized protein (DUF1778 family)
MDVTTDASRDARLELQLPQETRALIAEAAALAAIR